MPKLRNANTDVGMMAQYLARKCVIHSPQAELDMVAGSSERQKMPRFGKNKKHGGAKVHMLKNRDPHAEPQEFVAIAPGGRAMRVFVEEVNPDELSPEDFLQVGS